MNIRIVLMIIGMTVVTYLPRALPLVMVEKIKLSPKVEKFLKLIPYTAMAALIFPGILSSDAADPVIGIVGGAAAVALAWLRCPVMVCVLGAIAADLVIYLIR